MFGLSVKEKVERDIRRHFGWRVDFTIDSNGHFSWRAISGEDRYDLYPGMSREEADKAVMDDIEKIVRRYIPHAKITDYDMHGVTHYREG